MCLVLVGRIHEHEASGALWIVGGEDAHVETTDRGPGEHHRAIDPAADEKFSQLTRDPACSPRRRTRVAVPHPPSVITADPCESSNLRLDEAPVGA